MATPSPARQTLSVTDAMAIIIGIVVGAGIFETPPLVAAKAGNSGLALSVWVVGGVLSLMGALCYAELATTYPDSGGMYYYLRRAFGDVPAFLLAWSRLAIIQTGSIALLGFVFGDYASQIFSLGRHSSAIYAALATILLTALNMRGVQFGRWTQNLLSIAKVLGVVMVIVAGFSLAGPAAQAPPVRTTSPSGIGMMMVFVLLTYGGWQEAGYISAELKNVRRNMAIALLGSMALITTVFVLINAALLHALGLAGVAGSKAVVAEVLRRAAGPGGALLVSAAVMVAALGSMQGTIFTGARTNFALGRDFPLFRAMAYWHERRQTPSCALALQGAISLGLVALGSVTRQGFQTMVEYTAPVFWLFVFLTGVALLRLRRKDPDKVRPFRVPAYPFTPILFSATSAYLLYASLAYTGFGAVLGVVVLLLGALVLYASRARIETPVEEQRRVA